MSGCRISQLSSRRQATHGFALGTRNSAEYVPLFGSIGELLTTLSPGMSPAGRAVRRRLWSGLDASEALLYSDPAPSIPPTVTLTP